MVIKFNNAEKQLNDTLIFPAFNLTLAPGTVTAIYSTINVRESLVDILLGKMSLSNGNITILGNTLHNNRKELGFFFLRDGFYERLTIEETIMFFMRLYNSETPINDVIYNVQLESYRKRKSATLTFSEKKRLHLACLLVQNPNVFILEEPEQNLDIESKRIFYSVFDELRREEKVILILTGNMENAITAADSVYQLNEDGLQQVDVTQGEEEEEKDLQDEQPSESQFSQPLPLEKIPTKVDEKIVLFDPPEIDYIESMDGKSYLYIKGESFRCTFTLAELEKRLLPFGFFRCHRSYIVNLQKVREVMTWTRNSYSLILDNMEKSTIPLSKAKMSELKELLGI